MISSIQPSVFNASLLKATKHCLNKCLWCKQRISFCREMQGAALGQPQDRGLTDQAPLHEETALSEMEQCWVGQRKPLKLWTAAPSDAGKLWQGSSSWILINFWALRKMLPWHSHDWLLINGYLYPCKVEQLSAAMRVNRAHRMKNISFKNKEE